MYLWGFSSCLIQWELKSDSVGPALGPHVAEKGSCIWKSKLPRLISDSNATTQRATQAAMCFGASLEPCIALHQGFQTPP